MKALSFLQPWLHAVLHCGKYVENRTWHPPAAMMGQRFALHASRGYDAGAEELLRRCGHEVPAVCPRGAVLGVATLAACGSRRKGERLDAIVESPWFFGPVGWLLEDIRVLAQPVPCAGALSFWRLPDDVEAKVLAQLGEAAP